MLGLPCMPSYLPTYLPPTYLPTYLPARLPYLPTLPTYSLLLRLLEQQVAGELGAVAPDDEEHVDPPGAQGVADLDRIEAATPRLHHS